MRKLLRTFVSPASERGRGQRSALSLPGVPPVQRFSKKSFVERIRPMSALDDYLQKVQAQLNGIRATQTAAMTQAAAWVATALQHDGFIYTFGSGHSHVLAEETFYRAGGLVRAAAILD